MKKNMRKIMLTILSVAVMAVSCKKDSDDECSCLPPAEYDTLSIVFNATTGGSPMEHLKGFQDPLGRSLNVELFQFYVSNIKLLNTETGYKSDDVFLVKLVNQGSATNNEIKVRVPVGTYTGIEFGVGLDPALNATTPSQYPDGHPLSVYEATYWTSWNSYIFTKHEGKFDSDNNGSFESIYAYHTGFNDCYFTNSFSKDFEVQSGLGYQMEIDFEYNDIFFGADTVDMYVLPTWHGDISNMTPAIDLAKNFSEAWKLK